MKTDKIVKKHTLIGLFILAVCIMGLAGVRNVSGFSSKGLFGIAAD